MLRLIKNKKYNPQLDLLISKKNILKSKRSQAGSGFSWFVGFIIIFFIMFLFTSASLINSKTKKVPAVGVETEEGNLILTKQLLSFLNTEVEVDGEKTSIKEIISGADIKNNFRVSEKGSSDKKSDEFKKAAEKSDIFKKMALEIFSKVLPFKFIDPKVPIEKLWVIAVQLNSENRFSDKSVLGLGYPYYFVEGSLSTLCVNKDEVIYSEIPIDKEVILFLCVNIKELEGKEK